MIFRDYRIEAAFSEYHIVDFGDMHWGALASDESDIKERVKEIAEGDNYWWIGMGDYLDAINYSDKRFDPNTLPERYRICDLDDLVLLQAHEFCDIFDPIAHKCIGLHSGNHEFTIQRLHQVNIHHEIIRRLNRYMREQKLEEDLQVITLGEMAFINISIPNLKKKFTIWSAHGTGRASSPETALRKLKNYKRQFEADIYQIGHLHYCVGDEEISLAYGMKEVKKIFLVTGSFLKSYIEGPATYAERRIYSPIPLSAMEIIVDGEGLKFRKF